MYKTKNKWSQSVSLSVSTEGTAAQPSIPPPGNAGNSTLRLDVNLHLEAPCTQEGVTQETQRSSPSDGDRGEATAEVKEPLR